MTCILVLGQHRGGTSVTSRVLHTLGVDMNPTSGEQTWEDVDLQLLHEEAMGFWMDPQPNFGRIRSRYRSRLKQRCEKELWGYKDPRLNFLLPDVLKMLYELKQRVRLVAVSRSIEASAQSLVRANPGLDLPIAQLITSKYQLALERCLAMFAAPSLRIDYDMLVDYPEQTVERLAEFVELPVSPAAVSVIDPALRHFGGTR